MAEHRHKRETNARRFPRAAVVAAPLAVLATLSTVSARHPQPGCRPDRGGLPHGRRVALRQVTTVDRPEQVSRGSSRLDASTIGTLRDQQKAYERRLAAQERRATLRVVKAAKADKRKLWTTTVLNLWTSSDKGARNLGELEEGKQVLVTGRKDERPRRARPRGRLALGHRRLPQPRTSRSPRPPASRWRPAPTASVESGLTAQRRLRLPLGLPRVPADHDLRRLGQPRRALLGPGARHHDQRRALGTADRGVPPGPTPPSCTSTTSCGASTSGRPVRASEGWRTFARPRARRRPTTTTTCTSRRTDRPPGRSA